MNAKKKKIFCVVGTRPEFIKMFPVYKALKEKPELDVKFVLSSQHKELIESLGSFFNIKVDFTLDIKFKVSEKEVIASSESAKDALYLSQLSSEILLKSSELFANENPDLVLVQGDTITVQQVALAAFYHKIPLGHVEAGLRTNDIYSPFPEEMSRRLVSQIATLHFAPTEIAAERLRAETKNKNVYVVGNTVVDALKYTEALLEKDSFDLAELKFAKDTSGEDLDLEKYLDDIKSKKLILLTAHRRENFDGFHFELVKAIETLLKQDNNLSFVVSLHRNPKAREVFSPLIKASKNDFASKIKILEACNYPLFVKLMKSSDLLLTDSGGIQEEGPYLQKPVLIFRKETERPEGLKAGVTKLLEKKAEKISEEIVLRINDAKSREAMIKPDFNLYGDGRAALKIADLCEDFLFAEL